MGDARKFGGKIGIFHRFQIHALLAYERDGRLGNVSSNLLVAHFARTIWLIFGFLALSWKISSLGALVRRAWETLM